MRAGLRLHAKSKMLHHLIIGTWTKPGAIFTVAFDDEALSLQLVKRTEIPKDEPISWITFDHARKNIYGASMKKWSSFKITTPTDIVHETSHGMSHVPEASLAETNTRAIFCLAAKKPPYAVYGNPFYDHAGHGNVFSTDATGKLAENIQNYEYQLNTGIHGMVFDAAEEYIYSADLRANKVWTHRKKSDGTLEYVGDVEAPNAIDHPRWVEIHPNGKYLYVLMEAGNNLVVYTIDPETRLPTFSKSFPLIPEINRTHSKFAKQYRSDVVFLSSSKKTLFATTRSNTKITDPNGLTGYISAFNILPDGDVEKQIFMQPTPTSGGHSNAVSCCPWDDKWVALTDDDRGGVEIYRWDAEGSGGALPTLSRVARLELPEGEKHGGFGMNAIWYD